MTVKEFSEKYKISVQSVYAKIRRNTDELDGHIAKSGGQLVIDEYAEEVLKPRIADFSLLEKIENLQRRLDDKISECEKLKNSLAEITLKIENLQAAFVDEKSKSDDLTNQLSYKIFEIEKSKKIHDEQNLKISNFEKSAAALSEENLKLSEKVRLLADEILERDRKLEIFQEKIAELEAAASKRLFSLPSKKH
ncbi:MAG: hypothetical protein NC120_13660 [Ruminococcus sp.]|nr:hypothetical protein [Ruminococcus sp.]